MHYSQQQQRRGAINPHDEEVEEIDDEGDDADDENDKSTTNATQQPSATAAAMTQRHSNADAEETSDDGEEEEEDEEEPWDAVFDALTQCGAVLGNIDELLKHQAERIKLMEDWMMTTRDNTIVMRSDLKATQADVQAAERRLANLVTVTSASAIGFHPLDVFVLSTDREVEGSGLPPSAAVRFLMENFTDGMPLTDEEQVARARPVIVEVPVTPVEGAGVAPTNDADISMTN